MINRSLTYDETLCLLRGMKSYSQRCLQIAATEQNKGNMQGAEHMQIESRIAQGIAEKIEAGIY